MLLYATTSNHIPLYAAICNKMQHMQPYVAMRSICSHFQHMHHMQHMQPYAATWSRCSLCKICSHMQRMLSSVARDHLGTLGRTRSLGHTRSHTITWAHSVAHDHLGSKTEPQNLDFEPQNSPFSYTSIFPISTSHHPNSVQHVPLILLIGLYRHHHHICTCSNLSSRQKSFNHAPIASY